MPATTVYIDCGLCSAATARHSSVDDESAAAAAKAEAIALGFRELADVSAEGRRRFPGWVCPACVDDIVAITAPKGSAAYDLVTHLIRRLHDDGDLAYILGGPSQSRALMVKAIAEKTGKSEEECEEIVRSHFVAAAKRTRFNLFEIRGVLEDRVTRLEIDEDEEPLGHPSEAVLRALDRLDDFFADLGKSDEELDAERAHRSADAEEAARKAEIARVQVPLFGDEGR